MSFTRNNLKARVEKANINNVSRLTDSFGQDQIAMSLINKFAKSRKQCDTQIQDHLKLLTDYKFKMQDMKKDRIKQALINFESNFDRYMNQILKDIRDLLENQKKRLMQTIMNDRQKQLAQQKQIKRRIDQQISQVKQMKKGLGTENYKQYIAKIVTHDFNFDALKIKESMDKLSYDTIHLRVDEKRKQCYRKDIPKVIICEQYDLPLMSDSKSQANILYNREMMKKSNRN